MTPKTLTACALLAIALPTLALAENEEPGNSRGHPLMNVEFAQIDADSNEGISRDEWMGFIQAQVAERHAAHQAERADRLLEAGDSDGNGELSRDEIIAGMTALAEDRRAQRAERGEGRREMRREMRHEMRGHGHGGERMGRHGRRGGDPMEHAAGMFERIDRDDSGSIDASEFERLQARMAERAERMQERQRD